MEMIYRRLIIAIRFVQIQLIAQPVFTDSGMEKLFSSKNLAFSVPISIKLVVHFMGGYMGRHDSETQEVITILLLMPTFTCRYYSVLWTSMFA
jgi:hypothetical protein